MDTSRPAHLQPIELPPEEILARMTDGDREQLLEEIVARHFEEQRARILTWELGDRWAATAAKLAYGPPRSGGLSSQMAGASGA